MKLPKHVKIGPVRFKVVTLPRRDFESDDTWGICSIRSRQIKLANDLDRKTEAQTLLHEILHGIYRVFTMDSGDPEERVVESLEFGITAVMCDNPGLFAAIEKEMS